MKRFLAIAIIALGLIVSPIAVSANERDEVNDAINPNSQLEISPVTSSVVLKAGTSIDYALVVTNRGDEEISFTAYAKPYSVLNEDYDIDFSEDTPRTQLSRWISFVNPDGSTTNKYEGKVPADGQIALTYRITVPEDIPAGGQYSAIFIQADNNNNQSDVSSIGTVTRLGAVVYGRTNGDTEERAEIAEYDIPGFMFSGPITATSIVRNSGNTDFNVEYSFSVTSITGTELFREEKINAVLPDTSRKTSFEWKNTQPMGIFNVTYRVKASDQIREETRVVIILPIYMLIIAIFILTLLIIWIIILIRKRRERKSRLVV